MNVTGQIKVSQQMNPFNIVVFEELGIRVNANEFSGKTEIINRLNDYARKPYGLDTKTMT